MREVKFLVRDASIHERLREIHQSWSPAVRHRRAEEGRQRREEFLHLILEPDDDRSTHTNREATARQSADF
jgi:hypothetical protein